VIIREGDVERDERGTRVVNPAWRDHQVTMADAEIAATEVLLAGPKRFLREQLVMPDGETVDWCYVATPPSVLVVPVLPDGQLVMVYQYRWNHRAWTLEFPAGEVAGGEEPEEAMRRELAEETGYVLAGDAAVTKLGTFSSLPSETDKLTHMFLARPVVPAGPAVRDKQIERLFGMSTLIIPAGHVLAEARKTVAGTETVTALLLAAEALRAGARAGNPG
jgi:ADP-ribose pyrophosphatase